MNSATTGLSALRVPWLTVALALPLGLALAMVSGCAVGPNFRTPRPPDVSQYAARPAATTAGSANIAGGAVQHFAAGADIPSDWWVLFHSKALDALIEQSLAHNPNLQSAQAALTQAREEVLAQRGSYYPSAAASLSASRQKQSQQLAPTPNANLFQYSLFTPQVTIAYVPDVFGLNRRMVESARAQAQAVRYQMIATTITLSANVAAAAIQEAALQGQINVTRQLVDLNTHMVGILRYQFAKGYASRLDLAAQQAQLAQVEATLPALRKQRAQQRDLLAVLAGRFPSQAPAQIFGLSSLQLPSELPLSLPSKLVVQRPDVLQAQANLHAASAQVGVAIANRLPEIELTADAGSAALAASQLFTSATNFAGLGATLTAPIFEGRTLLHQERAAKAAYVQAAAQYRATVLAAFQNVADTLAALEQDADALKAAATAERAAQVALDLSQQQSRAGYVGYLALLSAEQGFQQARISLVQSQANRYLDTVALFQALGGGWWHEESH